MTYNFSYHIYASCFLAMMWGKPYEIFAILWHCLW